MDRFCVCVILSRKFPQNVTKWQVTNQQKQWNSVNTAGNQWKINLINYSRPSAWWEPQYQKSWVIFTLFYWVHIYAFISTHLYWYGIYFVFFKFLPELTFSCKLHWVFFSSIYLTKKKIFFFFSVLEINHLVLYK